MKKIKVAVLMGGKSAEYEISLISGREVIKSLDKKKYKVLPVIIPQKGIEKLPTGVDVAFIAMHGTFGEDGTIQGLLDMAQIPFTGPGVLASAIGMDKIVFRKIMESEGIAVPKYIVLPKGEKERIVFKALGKPPYFVKPHNQGSSVGTSIVRKKQDLKRALKLAYKYSNLVLVEEYIKGKELTCGIIGNLNPIALPVVEIIPKNEFFDYESKYASVGTEEITPARISKNLTKKVQEISLKTYKVIGAKGFSRIDLLLKNEKYPVVLEINTIPGLTPVSLMPKAAKAAGISYSQLLDKIINYALEKLD